jgi:hypothetical protein
MERADRLRTPAERAAIAIMREPLPELGERNAFPALWLEPLRHARDGYQAQRIRTSRAGARCATPGSDVRAQRRWRFVSAAQGRYAELPTLSAGRLVLGVGPDCVSRVRADPDAAARRGEARGPTSDASIGCPATTTEQSVRSARARPFRRSSDALFAALLSDAALRHVAASRERSRAFAPAPAVPELRARSRRPGPDELDARRCSPRPARVHAEIRAEAPAEARAEPDCGLAFAPLADAEFDLCPRGDASTRSRRRRRTPRR